MTSLLPAVPRGGEWGGRRSSPLASGDRTWEQNRAVLGDSDCIEGKPLYHEGGQTLG